MHGPQHEGEAVHAAVVDIAVAIVRDVAAAAAAAGGAGAGAGAGAGGGAGAAAAAVVAAPTGRDEQAPGAGLQGEAGVRPVEAQEATGIR